MKKLLLSLLLVGSVTVGAYAQVSLNVNWTDLTFRGPDRNAGLSFAFNRNRVIAAELFGSQANPQANPQASIRGYKANTGTVV